LVGSSPNHGIENASAVVVILVSQHVALGFENESGSLDLSAQPDRVYAMQSFSIPQARPGFSNMVDDEQYSTRFQCVKKCPVKRCDVGGS